jgi:putative sigma-54 modulation protein
MRIEFTGRQLEVPEAVRNLAARKLKKLERVLPGITHARVLLRTDRHRQVAEVTLHSRHLDLTAVESTGDIGASLAKAAQKLLEQAKRYTAKRRDVKRRGGEPAGLTPPGSPGTERVVRVIKSRGYMPKPMTVDEAVLEMEDRKDGPLVFREASGSGMRVLYWRKDGHLGLIEPEA